MKLNLFHQPLFVGLLSLFAVACAFGAGSAGYVLLHRPAPAPAAPAPFPPPVALDPAQLTAQSAILYDPTDGRVLFAKNPHAQLPLASLTKLMTAEVVLARMPPNAPVTITKADLAPYGDWGLRVGDVLPLSDLLKLGLIASANDAMEAAAASLGGNYVAQMNQKAAALGLTQTYFYNPTGLDLNTEISGAYSSAADVARLASIFYQSHPEYFELTTQPDVSIDDNGRTLFAAATAAPILNIPGYVGAKTGYTDLAGGNLVAIFDIEVGHPLVAVALGSTENGRFSDIRTIIDAARGAASRPTL